MLDCGEGSCAQGRCVWWKEVGAVAGLERRLSLHRWYGCLLALILSKAGGVRSGNNWRDVAWERLTGGPKCHSGKVVGKRNVNSRLAISRKMRCLFP